jgi:HTH-type transcriptional regulator, transcriptional repressor of NAD biosynthesis genes
MPPHKGHCSLIDFARHFAEDLTVVVGSLASEPIPGEQRFSWMKELFPQVRVVHLTDENPQYPHEHPDFWTIWKNSLERIVDKPIDLLFASEDYGRDLAEVLGARFIPNNDFRSTFPVSGSEIRGQPVRHWDMLPDLVKPYFTQRILVFGPESTGKTTLCQKLAQEFHGIWVPEYARTWLRDRGESFDLQDMEIIARAQWASEEALSKAGKPFVFCDTDPLSTAIWCRELFGEVPESVQALAKKGQYDLTLLLDVDVPWVSGELRLRPEDRLQFFQRCRTALAEMGRTYHQVSGDWESRWRQAHRMVNGLRH